MCCFHIDTARIAFEIYLSRIENVCMIRGVRMKYVDEVQPVTVVEIYKRYGMTISLNQAEEIVKFLYLLADVMVDNFQKEIEDKVENEGKLVS